MCHSHSPFGPRPFTKLSNARLLISLYVEQGKGLAECAAYFSVTKEAVRGFLHRRQLLRPEDRPGEAGVRQRLRAHGRGLSRAAQSCAAVMRYHNARAADERLSEEERRKSALMAQGAEQCLRRVRRLRPNTR